MRNKILLILLAACMSTVLSASTLTATIINTTTSGDDYLFYLGCTSSPCTLSSPDAVYALIPSIFSVAPPGDYPFTETIPNSITAGYATAIGFLESSPSDVQIALGTGVASAGESWSTLFPSTPESTIASELASGDTAGLLTFLGANLADLVPFDAPAGVYWEFSGATDIGSVSATITPEPGTLGLTGLLLGGLVFVYRRRLTAAPARTEK